MTEKKHEKVEHETTSYPYPKELFDNEGYPTQEALDYIRNWCIEFVPVEHGSDETAFVVGEFVNDPAKIQDLIDYVNSLWIYNDAIVQNENYLEIHTFGWSGNEEIIEVLKKSTLWHKLDMTQAGGHYYFKMKADDYFKRVIDYMFDDMLKEKLLNFMAWVETLPDPDEIVIDHKRLVEEYFKHLKSNG